MTRSDGPCDREAKAPPWSSGWARSRTTPERPSACRASRVELQRFADASGLDVSVCHFPPGTSKWNKIEHRLFSQITANWRGRPLVTREAVVELIQATTTRAGLRVRAKLDPGTYAVKKEVTPEQLKRVRIRRAPFRGEWNYTVRSAQKERQFRSGP
jgi:hypothetical protein